jgi:hypothetical protein
MSNSNENPNSFIENSQGKPLVGTHGVKKSLLAKIFDGPLVWVLLGILAVALVAFPLRGGEFLVRLATGRALAEGMTLGSEPFSYALKDKEWVHGSWLFDRLRFGGWQLDGGNGRALVAVKTGFFVLLGLFVLAKAGMGSARQLFGPVLSAAVLIAVSGQADLGPHLATQLGLILLLIGIAKTEQMQGKISKWVYPFFFALFCAWVNLDTGFIFGLVVTVLWLVGDLISTRKVVVAKISILPVILGGVLVNPFFIKAFQMPESLGFFDGVQDLKGDNRIYSQHLGSFVDWLVSSWNLSFLPLPAVIGITLLLTSLMVLSFRFIKYGKSTGLWRILVLVGFLFLGLARFRLISIGALAAAFFLAECLFDMDILHSVRSGRRAWMNRIVGMAGISVLAMIALFSSFLRPSPRTSREFGWGFAWSEGLRELAQTVASKSKAETGEEKSRMLVVENNGEMASYLLWFAPKYQQFLDGRWARSASVLGNYKSLINKMSVLSDSKITADGSGLGVLQWRNSLSEYEIKTVAANLLGDSAGVTVAPRFSSLSDWESPYLAGAGQVARLREPAEREPLKSQALVQSYLDQLILEATNDRLEWEEGKLDQPVRPKKVWEFWVNKPPISGKSIEAEIRSNLSGQYRKQDARVAQSVLALRQSHIAMAEQPDNPGGLLVVLQCLGQLSDALGIQQEGGVLSDLIELEMVTLAQRVLDLAGDLEDERSDKVRSARLVLYQVALRRNFWDQMEEHGKALLESSRSELFASGEDGMKRLEALEEQIRQIAKRRGEAEDRFANSLERIRSNSGGKEPPQFVKAVTAMEMGLPLRAMQELQSSLTAEQLGNNEQLQISFTLLNLQLALQLGRVDQVRAFLDGKGKEMLDRGDNLRLSHPGTLLPQLLNPRVMQMENRGYPLYDWLLIQCQIAAGRYREAVDGLEKLGALKQELLKPALKQSTATLILNEGPFGVFATNPTAKDVFSVASQCLGAGGIPGLSRTLNPLMHEMANAAAGAEVGLLRQNGMIAEIEGVCGYFALVSGEVRKARMAFGRSMVKAVSLGYVVRALMRSGSYTHPISPLLQEVSTNLAEGVVPSWHTRLGWVRILESVLNLSSQALHGL